MYITCNYFRFCFLELTSSGVIMRNHGCDPCGVQTHDSEVARRTPYLLGHHSLCKNFYFQLFIYGALQYCGIVTLISNCKYIVLYNLVAYLLLHPFVDTLTFYNIERLYYVYHAGLDWLKISFIHICLIFPFCTKCKIKTLTHVINLVTKLKFL